MALIHAILDDEVAKGMGVYRLDPRTFVGDPMVWGPAWIMLEDGRAHRRVMDGTDPGLNQFTKWLTRIRDRAEHRKRYLLLPKTLDRAKLPTLATGGG